MNKILVRGVYLLLILALVIVFSVHYGAPISDLEETSSPKSDEFQVLYVHARDVGTARFFKELLDSQGLTTELVDLADIEATDFSACSLILIGSDTQHSWKGAAKAVDNYKKPVVGLGEGGYSFFGELNLRIGARHGWHGRNTKLLPVNPSNSRFWTAKQIDTPTDKEVAVYEASSHVGVHLPEAVTGVTPIGREVGSGTHYVLIQQAPRYMLWGFTGSPEAMTPAGRELFVHTCRYVLSLAARQPRKVFESMTLRDLVVVEYSKRKINGSDNENNKLQSGTILAARTSDGRYSKFMIQEYGYNLVICWVTYSADGAVHSQGSGLNIRGTWQGDLDSGKEGGEAVDFWWEQVDRTERYLVPRNGAQFAILRRPKPTETESTGKPARRKDAVVRALQKLGGKFLAKGFKSSWSPDGTRIVFGLGARGTARDDVGGLGILDLKTVKVTELVAPGKDPAWSPGDGKLIAYVTGYGNPEELWLVEAAGGNPRKLADGGFPTWSVDGKTLFFHSRKRRKLMAVQVDAEKSEPTELMDMSWWYPAISPNGKEVAYRSGSQLLLADMESGKVLKRWRFPGSGRGFLGGWSTDGKQIGFGGYGGTDTVGLWFVDVETGQGGRMAADQVTMPDWSRDGAKVAFDLRSSEGNEVWMIDAEALEKLPFEELPIERYAVPDGGVNELLKFIEDLKQFRPRTPREHVEHRNKAQATLRLAAQRILGQEKDEWSKAYQTGLRVLLEIRITNIPKADRRQQAQTVEFVKTFLKAKLEKRLESLDVDLAMSSARALETSHNLELAAEAYSQFARLIAENGNAEFSETVKHMKDAAKRLSDAER